MVHEKQNETRLYHNTSHKPLTFRSIPAMKETLHRICHTSGFVGALTLVLLTQVSLPMAQAAETLAPLSGASTATCPSLWLLAAAQAGLLVGVVLTWAALRFRTPGNERKQALLAQQKSMSKNAANYISAGGIHEFNNILCSIQGFTDLALLRGTAEAPGHQELKQIRIGAGRAARLLELLERFHLEDHTLQPVPLGLLMKGYGKYVQVATANAEGEQGQPPSHIRVQVEDMETLLLAKPVQMQELLTLLQQTAADTPKPGEEEKWPNKKLQLVVQRGAAYPLDQESTPQPRLELVLHGATDLSPDLVTQWQQLAMALDGEWSQGQTQEEGGPYCMSLPGISPDTPEQ
ncbi:MAG: hypothetical protein HQQ73_04220 [Desulfobulbaceae bacterium]|nr:hypothetical protein [Desulfobulbaceae bacterium]